MAATATAPVARPVRHTHPVLQARPIAVAAYPADRPRWVTYAGKRQRVVALQDVAGFDPALPPVALTARRVQVELANGQRLLLVQDGAAWLAQ